MFSRTPSGIRNTDLFYHNQYLVMVEGKDDIPFWEIFFPEEISGYVRKFKSVGGAEIKKYVNQILENNAQFVVALDSDYRFFKGELYDHPQIVETLTHSIENIIINPDTLAKIICIESRVNDYSVDNVENWLEHFNKTAHDLMVADFLIQRDSLGLKCLKSNKCERFLSNPKKKLPFFCPEKIQIFIEGLDLDKNQFDLVKNELRDYEPSSHIRGHFLSGASLFFVNHIVNSLRTDGSKRRSISNDSFYTMLILACGNLMHSNSSSQSLFQRASYAVQMLIKLLSNNEI